MSPRKAFSLAMRGGLNSVWAPPKCLKAGGDMLAFSGVGDLRDLVLLSKEPIVSWWCWNGMK